MNATALMFGVFAVLVGIYPLLTRKNLIDNGVRTDSIVVRSERKKAGVGKKVFVLLKYEVDGVSHETEHQTGTSAFKYKDGETVPIIYRKDDPDKIIIENDRSAMMLSVTFIMIGAVVILTGVGIL
ncbi:MAG: DUF3592 domain-containing protein [Defluviitaleaceae bacterium]|nr:DUF3592 domain-containing protein [Defluviitaleaceae bacterium]